jgi:hypothetical protein
MPSTGSTRRLHSSLSDEPHIRAARGLRPRVRTPAPRVAPCLPWAVAKLIDALKDDRDPPRSLRIKRVQSSKDIWELSYSGDGRATFRYGAEVKPGKTHVIWLRVGAATRSSRGPSSAASATATSAR